MQCIRSKVAAAGAGLSRLARLALLALMSMLAPAASATAQATPPSSAPEAWHGAGQARYRVIHLGPGTIAIYPKINASGQVAFSMIHRGRTAGFFYDGVSVRPIGSLGGGAVYVAGLNDAGQIAGTAVDERGVENAFVWSAGGGMLDLRADPGRGRSHGMAINRHGVVAGRFGEPARPFRWGASGGVEDLGAIPALPWPTGATLINDAGLVAGVVTVEEESTRAFVWTRSGGAVEIDTLGSVDSAPVALGAGGEVAGNRLASHEDGGERPFLWTRTGGMVDLGTGGGATAWINAMTPGLHIAGAIGFADGQQRAMSWTRHGGMRQLGTLGGRTSVARAVNGKGQVVGFAEDGAGAMRAFVWSAGGGMLDLNRALRNAPRTLVLEHAMAIGDNGAIVASSNAGLVLLRPDHTAGNGHAGGHVLGPIEAPRRVKLGAPLHASVAFVDSDRTGTRSVDWSWGDGSSAAARRIDQAAGAASASHSHSYSAAGTYTVTATVVDRAGRSTSVSHTVTVTVSNGAPVALE